MKNARLYNTALYYEGRYKTACSVCGLETCTSDIILVTVEERRIKRGVFFYVDPLAVGTEWNWAVMLRFCRNVLLPFSGWK